MECILAVTEFDTLGDRPNMEAVVASMHHHMRDMDTQTHG
jgi:hypothetical protein